MKRFSLRMADAEYDKVKEYSEKNEISINDIVRQLIREWKPKDPVRH